LSFVVGAVAVAAVAAVARDDSVDAGIVDR